MLRRLMLSAFALCVLLALASCGATRLMAPEISPDGTEKPGALGKNEPAGETTPPSVPADPGGREDRPRREGDGRDTGLSAEH